ncbi:hypothetical protein GCM10011316_29330 [Roseibium aquae]|uniref:HTH cro/C1-type domain-containing protein n=1 Tax=Roseibium aquae TaxID=1323746 RepID=A0A916TLM8_9HYPH|nr:helix-turn-helix domain-containing protein [Roseibium aquae]GGB55406.1 hypothetical protein GCM10011316_29330 [Roseibium aquae]
MSNEKPIPYTWDEIEDQVRRLIIAQAATLNEFGPDDKTIVSRFLGFETDAVLTEYPEEVRLRLEPTHHSVFNDAYAAYQYLYQLEDRHIADFYHWNRIGSGLLSGCYPTTDPEGEPTPLCRLNNPPLRRVFQGFFARFGMEVDGSYDPSLADLSILSGLSEASVRASLSKEGFTIERIGDSQTSVLAGKDAIVWLQKRRGFIPDQGPISPEALLARQLRLLNGDSPFPLALRRIIENQELSQAELASCTAVDASWLTDLFAGRKVSLDIDALTRLAHEFGLPRSKFVARAIEYLLED